MKTWFLIGLLLTSTACATVPVRSPAATAAFEATQVIQSLDLIRDFAIAANAQVPSLLATQTTRDIVFYHESAIKAIHAVAGITSWKAAVLGGFNTLVSSFTPAEKTLLQPYIDIITAVLNGVL